jgi:hypothetical protein
MKLEQVKNSRTRPQASQPLPGRLLLRHRKKRSKTHCWHGYLTKVAVANEKQVQRLEKARELRKQLDEINTSIVADVSAVPATGADGKLSHGSISSDDEDDISDDGSLSTDQENRVAGYAVRTRETRQELPWTTKATIIFFHLHPWLGNKNFEVTSKVHSCNSVTLGGWLRKRDRILKWIDIVTGLTFNDALKAIPEQHRNKYESTLNPPYPPLDLKAFMNKIKTVKCRVAILHKNSKGTAQNSAAYAKKSKQAVCIHSCKYEKDSCASTPKAAQASCGKTVCCCNDKESLESGSCHYKD